MRAPTGYHIRDYQPGDEERIITLFAAVFGQSITHHQWRWKYRGTRDTVHAKLVVDHDDNLMGHAGAIPLRGFCRGQPVPFFQICDVMVHPAARGYLGQRNLFTSLVRSLLTDITQRFPQAFCYGFPGRRPFLLGERAHVYAQIEFAVETFRPSRHAGVFPLFRPGPLDWADARLDRLWASLSSRYALTLVRDSNYLRWRYAENPAHTYTLVGLFWLGKLIGWAVTRPQENRLLVVDLLVNRHWLRPALWALDRQANGSDGVVIWLPAGWRDSAGTNQPSEVVTAHMIWGSSYATAAVQEGLYYTMGDLDIF